MGLVERMRIFDQIMVGTLMDLGDVKCTDRNLRICKAGARAAISLMLGEAERWCNVLGFGYCHADKLKDHLKAYASTLKE